MKDKSNISLAISIIAIFISLYSLQTNDDDKLFVKSQNKTYVSADPGAKKKLDNIQKNMLESPLTPQMDVSQKLPKTNIKFSKDMHEFGDVEVNAENK